MGSINNCPACKNEVLIGDKFCRSCGKQLTLSAEIQNDIPSNSSDNNESREANVIICQSCGHPNSRENRYCDSCGTGIGTAEHTNHENKNAPKSKVPSSQSSPLKTFQSWKLTLGLGIIFIVVIIILQSNDTNVQKSPQTALVQQPPQEMQIPEEVMQHLQSLEQAIRDNPGDQQVVLQFANGLHDTRQFVRAIEMYQRYLNLNPTDADARVDLGVTYFELSRVDSQKHHEYLEQAEQAMLESLKHNSKHQLACFNLGIINLHKGEVAQAKEWLQRCAAIDSTSETGQKAQMLNHQHTFTNPT